MSHFILLKLLKQGIKDDKCICIGEKLSLLLDVSSIRLDWVLHPRLCLVVILAFFTILTGCRSPCYFPLLLNLSLSLLLLSILLSFIVDDVLPPHEVINYHLLGSHLASQPWMLNHLLHAQSLGRVQCNHVLKEILELRRVDVLTPIPFGVHLPKNVCLACCQQLVQLVLLVIGNAKGRSLREHSEEDDGRGKQIVSFSGVLLA